jgi:hypothetical protein
MEIAFTPIAIAALSGTILTVFLSYFPRIRVWFASLATEKASLLKLGFMVLIGVTISLLSYYGVIVTVPPFSWETALGVIVALILSNQPVASVLPAPLDVRTAIRAREAKFLKYG